MWAWTQGVGVPVSVAVYWNGASSSLGAMAGFAPNTNSLDTSASPDVPAHVFAVPPKNSAQSFWLGGAYLSPSASGNQFCQIVCPADTVIDLDVSITIQDAQNVTGLSVATAALGAEYWLALDGPTNNNLVPVGLNTTH